MEVASTILEGKLFYFFIILLAKYLFLMSVLVCLVKCLYEWHLVCVVVERSKQLSGIKRLHHLDLPSLSYWQFRGGMLTTFRY